MRRITFEQATARYVHRYTAEHIPAWSRARCGNGKYYAPQYRSDREWYDRTLFAGESALATKRYCYSANQTWPLGQWLETPYRR